MINKLNINVRSISGQDPPVREITRKIISTVKKIVKFTQLKEIKFYGSPRNNPHLKFGTLS